MKPFLIVAAGGTIDAQEYNFETGSVISFAKPAAMEIMEKVRPGCASEEVSLLSPFQKDSDQMTDEDRQAILEICATTTHDRIVVTHGTGTIVDTARLLSQHLISKTVVLTGSLPFVHDPSYAAFNLGSAVAACQLKPHGVYLAMSGEIVSINETQLRKIKAGDVTYIAGP